RPAPPPENRGPERIHIHRHPRPPSDSRLSPQYPGPHRTWLRRAFSATGPACSARWSRDSYSAIHTAPPGTDPAGALPDCKAFAAKTEPPDPRARSETCNHQCSPENPAPHTSNSCRALVSDEFPTFETLANSVWPPACTKTAPSRNTSEPSSGSQATPDTNTAPRRGNRPARSAA